MSSITNFLFQGQPVPPQPSGTDASTQFPLWYQDYLYNLAGSATNLAGQQYQAPPFPLVAGPSDSTQQSWQQAQNNVGNWQPAVGAAGAFTASGGAPTNLYGVNNDASNTGNDIASLGTGLTGALNQSTQSAIGGYLNPNLDFVSKGIESQLNNNLQQNILPSIQDRYVASGQSASPQQMQAENNAAYQTQQALGQALAPVYQNAYSGALNAAVGQTNQGFGFGQYATGLGTSMNQTDQQRALAAGNQFGQLGALNQQLGAGDVAQVAGTGQSQDTLNQANLSAAYQQFQNQQQWPYQNIGFLSNVLRGQQLPTTQQQLTLGYNNNAYSPSPLQAGVGTAALGAGLATHATGGRITRAKGGRVANTNRGALNMAMAA